MAEEGAQPNIEKIRALIALMEKRGLSRLSLTEDGVTVRLSAPSRAPAAATLVPASPVEFYEPLQAQAAAEEAPVPGPPEGIPLLSPTTGTFYRCPSPGEPPFVDVGDVVEVGQTVGIIMAMKVMSEVPAEVAGEVTAIPAEDGALVEMGAPLVVVKPV